MNEKQKRDFKHKKQNICVTNIIEPKILTERVDHQY